MAESGRNWTRRSIEELVENYIRRKGGGGENVYNPIGSIPAGYPWNPNTDTNNPYDSALPMIYYKGINYTGDKSGTKRGWNFNFCPYLIFAPKTPFNYELTTAIWYDKAYRRNTSIDGPNFLSDQRFMPLFFGKQGDGYDFFFQSLSVAYNGYNHTALYPNQIILDKDEFTGGTNDFGEPGVYICFRNSTRPNSFPMNIDFYWCKLDNTFVANNLFNGTQTCNFTNNAGQTLDSTLCATLNSMAEGVVSRNFPTFSTQSAYHWGALWLFILPHGNVNPGKELFKYDYIDLGKAYGIDNRYIYTTHDYQVVS